MESKKSSYFTGNYYSTEDNLGLLRARVEDTLDPLQLGRVRVRIPTLHGVPGMSEFLDIKSLPWAFPSFIGAGEDFGSYIVPPVGSTVWVLLEGNDPNKPVYIGSLFGTGSPNKVYNDMLGNQPNMGQYKSKGNLEIPLESQSSDKSPNKIVLYKSQKGHTILLDDTDNQERIEIIDRAGQQIIMECPVSKGHNVANGAKRGSRKASTKNQLDTGRIRILTKGTEIVVQDGKVSIKGADLLLEGNATFDKNLTIKGNLNVQQNTTCTGSLTVSGYLSANGGDNIEHPEK